MSLKDYDPNAAAQPGSGVFGLPFSEKEASLVLVPVPWEVTTSYGGGTADGPDAILEASGQIDLWDTDLGRVYEAGIFMRKERKEIRALNNKAKKLAQKVIQAGGYREDRPALKKVLKDVNDASAKLNQMVYLESQSVLKQGKILALLGGDHSIPLGAFKAAGEKFGDFGILHFDAHSDTRDAYEGFQYSHASIFHNALNENKKIKQLVQVGIRDYCEQELEFTKAQGKRVNVYFDSDLSRKKLEGTTWAALAKEMVSHLPKQVWISFDIDGLDPRYCPHTGTPVPGGLEFSEATYLIAEVARSGRTIIGFDLNEVAPHPEGADEWDANVGMRLLYKLCGWTLASQGKVKPLKR